MTQEEKYMKAAIREAKKAYALEEVPIGCVIVQNDRIIARGYNRRNTEGNTLAHAELTAIKKASKKTGDWRLEDCTMYVTLEPCQMCAGAIVQSRMKKVVIGSMNPKAGCAGSAEPASDGTVQPSGRDRERRAGRGMFDDALRLLPGTAR